MAGFSVFCSKAKSYFSLPAMSLSILISIISLVFSGVALYFTFKRDAHRVKISHEYFSKRWFEGVKIQNGSAFGVKLIALGHIDPKGHITWLSQVGDVVSKQFIKFPLTVESRSTLFCTVAHNIHTFPQGETYGFCIQLSCGRTFVSTGNLPMKLSIKLRLLQLVSRLSEGERGFPFSNFQYKP